MDDGSTDGSAETLADLDDPRLQVIRECHGGSAAARNAGLRLATGELVAFLDADDRWAPRNLERQSAFLESHPEVDMTFVHSLVVDEEGRSLGFKCSSRAGAVSLSQLLRSNEIGNGSCLLVRREALDQAGWFDPKLPACVDIDVWMRVASLRAGNVVAIPELLTFYRRRPGQISGDWRRMEAGYLQLLESLRRVAPLEVQREEYRSRAGRYRYYARLAREAGEERDGRAANGDRLLLGSLVAAGRFQDLDRRPRPLSVNCCCRAPFMCGRSDWDNGCLDLGFRDWLSHRFLLRPLSGALVAAICESGYRRKSGVADGGCSNLAATGPHRRGVQLVRRRGGGI